MFRRWWGVIDFDFAAGRGWWRCGMHEGRTVLAQILSGLSREEFSRCERRHPMARPTPGMSAYDHFVAMVFAQLTYREGLRDIACCLSSRRKMLYHSDIRGNVTRSNLACANAHRPAALFAEIVGVLMRRAGSSGFFVAKGGRWR